MGDYSVSNLKRKKKRKKRKFVDAITTAQLEMTTQFMSWGTQTCSPPSDPVRSFNPSEIATYD